MNEKNKNNFFYNKSLKKRVIYFLISFIIIFAIVIAFVSSFTLFNMKIESTKHNQILILKQVKESTTSFVNSIEKISLQLKKNINIEEQFLENLILSNENIDSVLVLDKKANVKRVFKNSTWDIKNFKVNHFEKSYFKKLENSDTYWSNIFKSTIDNKYALTYSFKLKDEVIVFFANLDKLESLTKHLQNDDKSAMITILDTNGLHIINTKQNEEASNRLVKTSEIFTKLINNTDEFEIQNFQNLCLRTLDYGMYTKLDKTNWNLIIRQNYSFIESYLFKILMVIFLTITIFTILAIFLSRKLLNTIFSSIKRFELETSKIANGDYKERLIPARFNEFKKLSSSFEKMRYEINNREKNLKQSLQNFKVLIDSTMEAIVIHDTRVIIDLNYSALKIVGAKDKSELIGREIKDFISDNYKAYVDDFLLKNKISIQAHEYEIVNSKNMIRNVIGQEGVIAYEGYERRLSVFLDITDLKNKDKLIYQQSKMASMGEMLSNIAHQWRQPLNTIRTLASATKLEKELNVLDSNELINRLELIDENTQNLSKIIDDFSSYIVSRKNEIEFNISNAIDMSLNFLNSSLVLNNINVIKNVDENLSYYGDLNEFTQALINIFNNSKDAFIENDIDERYILICLNKLDNKIILSIKDSARGISKEHFTKIFEPYFTTKHQSQGTGIGLYLTHKVVSEHLNGNIYAKNAYLTIKNKKYKGLEVIIEFLLNKD